MIVHTVISVGERNQVVRDATAPLSGGGGRLQIFAPRTMAMVTEIEAIGAYTQVEDAHRAAEAHLRVNPKDRVKIKVVTVDSLPAAALPPPPQRCVDCEVEIQTGHNRCVPCLKAFYQACRDADPFGGAPEPGLEGVPAQFKVLGRA